MSKHKAIVSSDVPQQRIRDGTRLMRTHETMVDFISRRRHANSLMDFFTSNVMGLNFLRTLERNLEDDLIYSSSDDDDDYYYDEDDDDDDDDEDDDDDDHHDPFGPRRDVLSHLEPHPRIRQLTDEEADKHAKELIEEEKRKERTERNKRKKMRKKEKKRLQKENAVKNILPEEEAKKSDSSDNPVIESKAEANESPESAETQTVTEAAGRDDDQNNNKEENLLNMIEKESKELKDPGQELDLNNSYVSVAESVPEETCTQQQQQQQPSKGGKKEKTDLQEVQLSEEKKPEPVEKSPEVQKKEEKQEPTEEKAVETTVEQLAKRSRELAGIGNRLAASGQYEAAVKYFTEAIKFNPKEFKLFGNRSLCYERTQQFEKALNDADVALSMQPKWIKGLFRKGKALSGLKRYYDASLIYKEVLTLESSSAEAMQELKRAQTLHLMEMGFTWAQSSEALKTHATLEEAVEALFSDDSNPAPADAGSSRDTVDPPVVREVNGEDVGEWIVLQGGRPRTQQIRETGASSLSRSQSPTPGLRNPVKPPLFSVWVGSLASSITYPTLHDLFSRAGTVYSIKMLLEQQCAFVNYTRKEDCDRAILAFNGMVVEGSPLAVRYPSKIHSGPSLFKKECFFWRTTGCTRSDCTYKHVPENKNIDKDKFTSRLGNFHM